MDNLSITISTSVIRTILAYLTFGAAAACVGGTLFFSIRQLIAMRSVISSMFSWLFNALLSLCPPTQDKQPDKNKVNGIPRELPQVIRDHDLTEIASKLPKPWADTIRLLSSVEPYNRTALFNDLVGLVGYVGYFIDKKYPSISLFQIEEILKCVCDDDTQKLKRSLISTRLIAENPLCMSENSAVKKTLEKIDRQHITLKKFPDSKVKW